MGGKLAMLSVLVELQKYARKFLYFFPELDVNHTKFVGSSKTEHYCRNISIGAALYLL